MHSVVATLLGLSFGACTLAGCETVCSRPTVESPRPLDAVPPEDLAELFASSDLAAVTRVLPPKTCDAVCGRATTRCELVLTPEGPSGRPTQIVGRVTCSFLGEETCSSGGGGFDPLKLNSCPFGCGRRPSSVDAASTHREDPLVDHFVQIAMLEALSVGAFGQLALDVREHAPGFGPRVSRAARDERRHARQARAVLHGLGAKADPVPRVPLAARSLEEAALDNAVEGCVRETFGAIVACIQAKRAGDPAVRAFFVAIARDELEHAALSWDVHRAFLADVSPDSRARIERAQRRALAELDSMPAPASHVRSRTGAPTRDEQRAIVIAMAESLPFGCA